MCGVFGVYNAPKAAELTVIGLHANQHRAIDFAGMVSSDGRMLHRERGKGLARQVFTKEMLDALHGRAAIGHMRYPTSGVKDSGLDDIQPVEGIYGGRQFAVAHNGNLTNTEELKHMYPDLRRYTTMDTEYIVRILEHEQTGDIVADLKRILPKLKGSYSLLIMTPDKLFAVRDPTGNRPLSLGQIGESIFLSSETCAFPNVDARYMRDVGPGTIMTIDREGVRSESFAEPHLKKCRFEAIYVSHPASVVDGEEVADFRIRAGRKLEELFPVEADVVTGIPDSGNFYAMGFGESGRSGAFFPAILRNHYVGRTFIAATQALRDDEVSQKFTFMASRIKGKRVVILDDSIVRGTTLIHVGQILRRLGALEVHGRIGCPPFTHPCRYGINTKSRSELLAASMSVAQMRVHLGFDSLEFLPLDVLRTLSPDPNSFCYSCMTGDYW